MHTNFQYGSWKFDSTASVLLGRSIHLMHDCACKNGACLMRVRVVLGSSHAILSLVAVLAHLSGLHIAMHY